ncbi:MAG TPA: phage tail tape measure protein, partial [Pyrinomonadaceae bacterium]|nr:phage tail tape measure protein [Pyrinomonadaceae bacterium]
MNNLTTKQASRAFSNQNFDTRQMQDFIRVSKESTKISEVNARTQGRLAEETSRRTTNAKRSELRVFEQAERHKQRITEISAKEQVQASNNAFKAQENGKRREYQEFVRLERQKTQAAAAEARKRQNFGQNADMVGGGMRSAGIGLTTAVTLPVVAGFAAVLKIGAEYEQSMNLLQATTNATADEMIRADKIAMQLGSDLSLPNVSAKDASEAMLELGKAGFTVVQSMDAAKGTLQLATAANISAGEAAEITANALNMFGLEAKDAGRVADLLAGAASASSAEITDVAQSLQQAGAVFANAKVPIEDTVALIGQLANAGIKGSDAGTSLKTM